MTSNVLENHASQAFARFTYYFKHFKNKRKTTNALENHASQAIATS